MSRVYCRHCDYNPCMCGKHDYMTEEEARKVSEQEYQQLYADDPWAQTPNPFDEE